MTQSQTVTHLLARLADGDSEALDAVFESVYRELRDVAHQQLRRHQHATLNTTALVHEVYLKLAGQAALQVNERGHFLAIAARAMRQVLITYAAKQNAQKRGGKQQAITLNEQKAALRMHTTPEALVALDEALKRLENLNMRQSQVVEMRFFAGLTIEETAQALATSARTIKRDWRMARAWLSRELKQSF